MKELDLVKDGRLFTDDNGLVIYWQPLLDKIKDPDGVIIFRDSQGDPIGMFRILKNEYNYEGEVKINDEDGSEFTLNIDKSDMVLYKN